jgi:hypothetical protein
MALQLRAIATVALVGAAAGAKFTSTHYQDGKCTTQATACVKKESGGWCKPANLKPVPPQIIYFNVDVCENQTFDGSYYGDANFMAGIGAKNPHAKLKCNPSAIGQNIFADDKCTALVPPAKVDSALLASKQTKTDKDFGAGAIVFKQMNPYTALAPGGNCTAQGGKQECCIKLADVVTVDKVRSHIPGSTVPPPPPPRRLIIWRRSLYVPLTRGTCLGETNRILRERGRRKPYYATIE